MPTFNRKTFPQQIRLALTGYVNANTELPNSSFSLIVIVFAPLIAIFLFAIQTRGFIGYLHGKMLFFVLASLLYTLLIHRFVFVKRKNQLTSSQNSEFQPLNSPPSYSDWIRLLGMSQILMLFLPIVAILNFFSVTFFQFSTLILIISGISTIFMSFRFLIRQSDIHLLRSTFGILISATLVFSLFYGLDALLFTNPWELLLKFQAGAVR